MLSRNVALVVTLTLAGEASSSFFCRAHVPQLGPWRVELLECGPAQLRWTMMLLLGEHGTVWCLFVLCLLELTLRSGGDVARLASEERGELPGDASLHDDMPNLASDALGEDQADLTDILYDPFDRPEGEDQAGRVFIALS